MKRTLSATDGAVLIFCNVIGVGIFTTPGIVFGMVADSSLSLILWLAGGLYAIIGAHAYAQLAMKYPSSGGEYLFLSKVIHPSLGFFSGWASLIAGFSGAIAASAVGAGFYINKLFDVNINTAVIGIIAIGLITVIQVLSVKGSALFNRYLTILVVFIIVIIGIVSLGGDYESFMHSGNKAGTSALLAAFIPILFTYSGWNAAVYVAEEIKDPGKMIKKALIGGTLAVILVYLLLNFLYLRFIPFEQLTGSIEIGHYLATTILGERGALLIDLFIVLALLSSVSAMIMAGPRVYFAMSRDGYLPPFFKKYHARFHTPAIAIMIQSAWTIVLVLSGTFEDILNYTGFAIVLFSMLAIISALLMAHRRQVSVSTGWLIAYILFVMVSLAILVNSFIAYLNSTLVGIIIILSGGFIYWFYQRKKIRSS